MALVSGHCYWWCCRCRCCCYNMHLHTALSEPKWAAAKKNHEKRFCIHKTKSHNKRLKFQKRKRTHSKWKCFYGTFPSFIIVVHIKIQNASCFIQSFFFDVRWILRSTFTIHEALMIARTASVGCSLLLMLFFSLHLCVFMSCNTVCIVCTKYRSVYKNEMKTRLSRSYRISNVRQKTGTHTMREWNKRTQKPIRDY